jgi:hypothetical protein
MAHYDTVTKPALLDLERAFGKAGTPWEPALPDLKATVDAAAKAGATPNEIADAVGGRVIWNRFVRAIKRAKLV